MLISLPPKKFQSSVQSLRATLHREYHSLNKFHQSAMTIPPLEAKPKAESSKKTSAPKSKNDATKPAVIDPASGTRQYVSEKHLREFVQKICARRLPDFEFHEDFPQKFNDFIGETVKYLFKGFGMFGTSVISEHNQTIRLSQLEVATKESFPKLIRKLKDRKKTSKRLIENEDVFEDLLQHVTSNKQRLTKSAKEYLLLVLYKRAYQIIKKLAIQLAEKGTNMFTYCPTF